MSFVRKGLLSVSGSFAQALFTFLSGIMLARALTPKELGQYSLVISVVIVVGAILSLGLGHASIYYINNKRRDPLEIIPTVAKLSLLLALTTMFASTIMFQFDAYFGSMTVWAISFVAVFGFGVVLVENLMSIPLVFLRVSQYVLAKVIPSFIFFCLIGLSFAISDISAVNAWLYMAIGQIATVLLVVYFIREYLDSRGRTKFADVKSIAAYGLKMNLAYICLLLHGEVGLFLVRYFSGDFAEVGYYRLALRLAGALMMFPQSVGPLFFSRWSKIRDDIRLSEVEKVSRIFYLATFIVLLFILLIADELIVFLYGHAYIPAIPVLKTVLIGIGVRFVLMPIFSLFSSSGKPLLTTYVYLAALFVTVLLMCILVPTYGGLGAGVAFSAGYAVALIVCYYFAHRYLDLDIKRCLIMRPGDLEFLRGRISKTSAPKH